MLSSAMFSSLVGRCEAAQFLKPVLDEDHFGQGLGLPFFAFHHEESLSVSRNVPASDWGTTKVSRLLKHEARLAGGKTGPGLHIDRPDLICWSSPPIKQLFAVARPERLVAPLVGYLVLTSTSGERLNIDLRAP